MGQSQKSKRKKSETRTNKQLQKTLEETHDLLKEGEKKLAKCQKQLEETRAKLSLGDDLPGQLEEKEKKLTQISGQLKDKSEEVYELEKKVEKLTQLNQALQKENEELKQQQTEAKADTTDVVEIEAVQEELQRVKGEKDDLLRQLKESKEATVQPSEITMVKTKPALPEKIPSIAKPLQRKTPQKAESLKEVTFLQEKRSLEIGHPLRANYPFTVLTRLHFPLSPTTENMDVDSSAYDIWVLAADAEKKKAVARAGVANRLCAGVRDYTTEIKMPGLKPGNYFLRISTLALFAGIEESKEFELRIV